MNFVPSRSAQILMLHGLIVLASLVLVAMGSRLALYRVADVSCAGTSSVGRADREELNKWAHIVGVPAATAGVCSAIGGCFGTAFAYKKRQCYVQAAVVLISIAIVMAVTSMAASVLANFNGCGDYECDGPLCIRRERKSERDAEHAGNDALGGPESWAGEIAIIGQRRPCTNQTCVVVATICRAEFDSFCEYDNMALSLFFVQFAAAVSMCCGCCHECPAARCCQKDNGTSETSATVVPGDSRIFGRPARAAGN